MDFSVILSHPDKEEIIERLITGDTPKNINQWLKLKYSDKEQKHLHISTKLLQDFADNSINLTEQLKNDIQLLKTNDDTKISNSLLNNKTYKERLLQYINTELDIKKEMSSLIFMTRERVEQVFDKIQENPMNTKGDYVLIKWFELLFNGMEKLEKINSNAPDQLSQHNMSVEMLEKSIVIMQDTIREVLSRIDPEAALIFIEEVTNKFNELQLNTEQHQQPTLNSRMSEIKILKDITHKIEKE